MTKPPESRAPESMQSSSSQPRLTRRRFLTAGVMLPIASAALSADSPRAPAGGNTITRELPWEEGEAAAPAAATASTSNAYLFFNPAESAFIEAAVARLIPKDELGPGALEAGAAVFIDHQLAGAYGKAVRWYMQGPWGDGLPTQGWQTRLTPAQLYRAAIRETDDAVGKEGKAPAFARLTGDDQDSWLHRLEGGKVNLVTVHAKTFFELLMQNTLEGFFCDPIYGGNRDMVGWKLIGFPGAHYNYAPYVKKHGERYPLPPTGVAGRPDWNATKA
jgi:gluconate 2-dehydrogenase gamma chain